jgi:hypothetical protein
MSWLMLIPALAVGFLFGQLLAIFQVQKTRAWYGKRIDRFIELYRTMRSVNHELIDDLEKAESVIKQQQDMLNAAVAQVEFVRDRLAELMVKFATKESN